MDGLFCGFQRIWEEVKRRKKEAGPKLVTQEDLR